MKITSEDVGRRVTLIRGIDYVWYEAPEDTIVADVCVVYPSPGTVVTIVSPEWGPFSYSPRDVRLEPLQ